MNKNQKSALRQLLFKHKLGLFFLFLSTILMAIGEVFKAYTLQLIIDSATRSSMKMLRKGMTVAIIFLLFFIVAYMFQVYIQAKFSKKFMILIKQRWFEKILKQELCDYDIEDTSSYLTNFTVDTNMLADDYLKGFYTVMTLTVNGIVSLVAIFTIHPIFIIFSLVTCWIPITINQLFANKIARSSEEVSSMHGKFASTLKENFMGFEVIKIYNLINRSKETFDQDNERIEKAKLRKQIVRGEAYGLSFASSLGIWFGEMALGSYLVILGKMTLGQVMNVTQLLNNIVTPVFEISGYLTTMKAANKVYVEVSDKFESKVKEKQLMSIDERPHIISFQKVRLSHNDRNILNDIELNLATGKKYLLTGDSGSGKSSFIKMLLNIYADYEGKICMDGQEFRKIDKDSWYKHIAVVSQDNFVFRDSVSSNITLYGEYEKKEIERVIALCGLEEFVKEHAEGLNFQIEENGKNISGGERQRICLARALLRKPEILILDEATSALNSEMAKQVEKNILGLKNMTVLAISHRIYPDVRGKYDMELKFENHKVTCMEI